MAYFIALAALALVSVVATVWLMRTDGYGPVPTDPDRAARRREASPARARVPRPTSTAPETPAAVSTASPAAEGPRTVASAPRPAAPRTEATAPAESPREGTRTEARTLVSHAAE